MSEISKNKIYFLLSAALILFNWGFFISIEAIGPDDILVYYYQVMTQKDWKWLFRDAHMLLFNMLFFIFIKLVNYNFFLLRFFSLIFAFASLVMMFFLGRQFRKSRFIGISALLLSVSPFFCYFIFQYRAYSLHLFHSLFSLYFFLKIINGGGGKDYLAYAISTILLPYSFFMGILSNFALFLTTFFIDLDHSRKVKLRTIHFLSLIGMAPVLYYIFISYGILSKMNQIYFWLSKPEFIEFLGMYFKIVTSEYLAWVILVLIILAFLKCHKNRKINLILITWVIIPPLIIFLYSYFFHPIFLERGFTQIIAGLVLLAGMGLSSLENTRLGRKGVLVLTFLIVVFSERQVLTSNRGFYFAGRDFKEKVDPQRVKNLEALYYTRKMKWHVTFLYEKDCLKELENPVKCLGKRGYYFNIDRFLSELQKNQWQQVGIFIVHKSGRYQKDLLKILEASQMEVTFEHKYLWMHYLELANPEAG